ncbi:MAG: LysR family transcriptional regulator [Gammaproteobacteria bacterium]|nr:LysR family transcriptional regulator [Gammaproteobacteria bacterium]
MKENPNAPLPTMNALRVFEATARHLHFTRAAEELELQQSAVSRYIADLEVALGTPLFERGHRSVTLTAAGEIYHRAVATGLERIASGVRTVADLSEAQRVMVACGPTTSHLFVMPLFSALSRTLGEDVCLRILSMDPDMLWRLDDGEADLVLFFERTEGGSGDWVTVFREAIAPVCSPGFAAAHGEVLARPAGQWGSLPFLRLDRTPQGWSTWHDWFESAGYPDRTPDYTGLGDYLYLLEAAVAGAGLALGWRHFIERHLDAGTLVMAAGGYVETGRCLFGRLTERGRPWPAARRCLEAFGGLVD